MNAPDDLALPSEITSLLGDFGIDTRWLNRRQLYSCPEGTCLVVAQIDQSGREHLLTADTANAWAALRQAAEADGVMLYIASAFRSVERQAEICRSKLAAGHSTEEIFAQSAPPGFSEHHTGCAIDIGTPGCPPFATEFEATTAFAWLCAHATDFGFHLSYPRDNPQGFVFEPWHWRFSPP